MVNTVKFSSFAQASLSNPGNSLVGVTSPEGGANMQIPFPFTWETSTRPTTPNPGTFGYNYSLSQLEFWNGTAWVQLASGGSGTVNVGAVNDIAYYPATGTAIDGIPTAVNAGLFTDSTGFPSLVPATGTGSPVRDTAPLLISPTATSIEFTSTAGIIGTTTNDDANSGSVGYFDSRIVTLAESVPLSNNNPFNITFLSLPPGDYDVWGNVGFTGVVYATALIGWVSDISASQPDSSLVSYLNVPSGTLSGFTVPMRRFSLAITTTIFLSGTSFFTGTTGQVLAFGGIYARVRR